MHKVTTINLNGKAYQLEEKGYTELHAYLTRATKTLEGDPDGKEILADLEQAIADKCERFLQGNKDVVSSEQVATILGEMGPVEADKTATDDDSEEATTSSNATSRKLYQIPKGGMIAGVCNGLAAYLGIDVTIVRIVFILLAFATSGFWAFLYLILAFVLPTAKTDEQMAEAYGRRVTAQEIVDGAKGRAKDLEPALSNLGRLIGKAVHISFGVLAVGAALVLGVATVGWITSLWWIMFGNLSLHAQLASVSHWFIAAGVTAGYFLIALPLFAIARSGQRIARQQEVTQASRNVNRLCFGLWFAALAVLLIIGSSVAGKTRDYVNAHGGYLDINGNHLCVDQPRCNPQHRDEPLPGLPMKLHERQMLLQ